MSQLKPKIYEVVREIEAKHKVTFDGDAIMELAERIANIERRDVLKLVEKSPLYQLLQYGFARGAGHTYAEVKGVENVPNAILVVGTAEQAASLENEVEGMHGKVLHLTARPLFMGGRRHPIVIDHHVIAEQLKDLIYQINNRSFN